MISAKMSAIVNMVVIISDGLRVLPVNSLLGDKDEMSLFAFTINISKSCFDAFMPSSPPI